MITKRCHHHPTLPNQLQLALPNDPHQALPATHGGVLVALADDPQGLMTTLEPHALPIQWVAGQIRLGRDDRLANGPSASVLVPGPNQIASSPYPMPIIWLLPEAASPSASVQLDGESFGPVSPGMSLSQASEALGLPIEIDHNLLPKPRCLAAVIVGDPYSPFFVVVGGSDPAKSEIVEIENNLGDHSCS